MKRQLVITERAHQDIERNAVWWARNHSLTQAIDWQDAAALLSQGKAAHYVMGNFAVPTFKDGGMTKIGVQLFPG